MKKNLRGKIREFVQSEEGKVGVKSSLTLGAAVGSVLLAQAIIGTPTEAHGETCEKDKHCHGGQKCRDHVPIGNRLVGTCMDP